MKITLKRSVALQTLTQALETCNIKAKGQVLSEFLFAEDGGGLTVSSRDGTCYQTIELPTDMLDAQPNEAFLVSGQAVVDFLKQFQEEEVNCLYDEELRQFMLGSKAKGTKFVFPTSGATGVENVNFVRTGAEFSCNGQALANALRLTAFAAATDYTRAPLTAVRLKMFDDVLLAEASDEMRISAYQVETENAGIDTVEFLLPKEAAESLGKLLADVDDVSVKPGERHILLEWGGTKFTASLEGSGDKFPALTQFLDGEVMASGSVSRADLLNALKLASLVARDSSMVVSLEAERIVIQTDEGDRGSSQDIVVTQEATGEASVRVATKYMLKAVETTSDPWITLEFRNIKDDIYGLVVQENDNTYRHLVLPVMAQNGE